MKLTIRQTSEIKPDAEGNTLSGYAIRWGTPSNPIFENGRLFTERIASSAFDKSLDKDIKLFYNHEKSMPLARTQNGSLKLRKDNDGLFFEATLPDTTLGRDVKELLRTGVLTGQMSFGFYESKANWSADRKEKDVTEGTLREISLVMDPAYPSTSSVLRSENEEIVSDEITTKRIELLRRRINFL